MSTKSPLTEQHKHPLFSNKMSSFSDFSRCTISPSMSISPNSFSMTTIFLPWSCVKMWLSKVVFPLPRNPVRTVIGIRSSLIAVFALSSSLCCCFCCSCCRANARSGNRPPLSARRRRRRRLAIIVPAFEREGESFRPSAKDAQRDGHIVVVVIIIIIIGLCGRWCCGLGRGCVLLPRVGKTKKKKKKKKRFCVGERETQRGPFSAAAYHHTKRNEEREKATRPSVSRQNGRRRRRRGEGGGGANAMMTSGAAASVRPVATASASPRSKRRSSGAVASLSSRRTTERFIIVTTVARQHRASLSQTRRKNGFLRDTVCADRRRVARVQQQMRREIGNMFQNDAKIKGLLNPDVKFGVDVNSTTLATVADCEV